MPRNAEYDKVPRGQMSKIRSFAYESSMRAISCSMQIGAFIYKADLLVPNCKIWFVYILRISRPESIRLEQILTESKDPADGHLDVILKLGTTIFSSLQKQRMCHKFSYADK